MDGNWAEDFAHSQGRFAASVSLWHGPEGSVKEKKEPYPLWAQWTGIILFILGSLASANGLL